jgi:hypothetical protein
MSDKTSVKIGIHVPPKHASLTPGTGSAPTGRIAVRPLTALCEDGMVLRTMFGPFACCLAMCPTGPLVRRLFTF